MIEHGQCPHCGEDVSPMDIGMERTNPNIMLCWPWYRFPYEYSTSQPSYKARLIPRPDKSEWKNG